MVRRFGEAAAVRDTCAELFGSVDCIIGTNGQEERVRTATKESGEAVSEGNVAENMTIPRKAIGKSPRLRSHAHDNEGLHGNGHTFRFINHNNKKGVASKSALKTKKPSIHHEPTANHINLSYL